MAEKTSITASAYSLGDYSFELNDDGTINITKYNGTDTDVTIPSSFNNVKVTSIGDNAFFYNDNIKSITIPNGVTSICESAFSDCTSLATVTIPDSVTNIGLNAFDNTVWYDNQADGLYYVGKVANYKGAIPENTSITLKNGTVGIADYAFAAVGLFGVSESSLISITLPNTLKSIGACAFASCTGLSSINIPNGVKSIGVSAFDTCKNLSSVTIPNSVTDIGNCAFADSGLTSLSMPNSITSIGNSAFRGCKSLSSITIPNSVTSIGDYAFVNCTSLASITIPNSVTSVGYDAFYNCTSLASVTIPNSITEIGSDAFGLSGAGAIFGFKIFCYAGTAGETYAKNNKFSYELLAAPVVTTTTKKVTTTAKPTTTTKKVTTTPKATTTTKKVTTTAKPTTTTTKKATTTAKPTTTKKVTTTTKKATATTKKNVKNATVPKIPDKAYSGKAICPAVKVKYGKTVLKNNTDYTVSYKFNKAIGKASVVIKGKGKYTGTKTVTFKINPKKQTVKLTSYNDAFKASWTKDSQATGYQVKYAKAKSFKGSTTVTAGKTTTSKKIKGKNKTTYYVKVRTYKTVNGTKYYGAWSTAKAVKTK